MGSYNAKYKTRKWTLAALSYVLDMARINSHAIYVISNAKEDVDSFDFEWELMKALVKPNMHTRLARGVCQNICKTQSHIYLESKTTK